MYVRGLLVASLAIALQAVPALADARPRTPRATLVEVLRGGKQVLVLDRTTGDYAVLKVGDKIQGFRISAIEDDQMILVGAGKPQRTFIIPLLDRSPLPPMPPASVAAPAPAPAAPAPAPAAPAEEAVMDPYAPAESPAVVAPPAPTSTPPVAPAPTPDPAAATSTPAPATSSAAPPAPAGATPAPTAVAPAPRKPAAAPRTEKRRLSRKQLNRALSDFTALSRDIKIERADGGGIVVTDLAKGSFAAQSGIEKGDIVRRVAGHAIDTVDDAASAYAAVFAAKQVVVEIERRGARLHLTYQLTD